MDNKNNIEWRNVIGFEGIYEVSNYGDVRSLTRDITHNTYKDTAKPKVQTSKGKPLRTYINNMGKGYVYVTLWLHSKHYKKFIHRLVAESFIENPFNKKEVNHKDANPRNNFVDNLEWVSRKENVKHSVDNDLNKCKKSVYAISSATSERIDFRSINDAARHFNCSHSNIIMALKKRSKTAKRHYWFYVE